MKKEDDRKPTSISMPRELWYRVGIRAAQEEAKRREILIRALELYLATPVLEPETLAGIPVTRKGIREAKGILKAGRLAVKVLGTGESQSIQVRKAKVLRALRAKGLPTSHIPRRTR